MATVNSAYHVSGGAGALQRQSLGQLSAASSTSGSLTTASAGDYMIERQWLNFDYKRIPKYNFATDHAMTVSGYAFAVVPTPAVMHTQLVYRAEALYQRRKVTGTFAGSYFSPQKFALYTTSAPDAGLLYTNQPLSGVMGVAGKVETSSAAYNRRPWVAATDTEIDVGRVTQFNFHPSVSANPWMSNNEKASFTSSIAETEALFGMGTGTYVAYNLDNGWNSIGLPTHQNVSLYMGPYVSHLWGVYTPGQEGSDFVEHVIDKVGNWMTTGHPGTPSMIPHDHPQHGNIHHIPEYDINRHSYVN